MTQQEQDNSTTEIEHFMQDRRNFGILHLLGMKIISAEAGTGRVGITVDERLMHPQQIVHGGVIFTLADTAMSMALVPLLPQGTRFGTIEAKINFMLPVRTGELLAEGTVVHMGRSTAVMEATVFNIVDGEQRAISKVLGTFSFARPKTAGEDIDLH
ncbi:MAG TPA: PaaI family thioesterase [Ktedonobacteraceae bacterium]|nr:PaaI family thioesterase [Ktedonobacteraceae bacterium]